jgi:hypothetical protein
MSDITADIGPRIVYGCTNPECDERMRGVTDEPTFCGMCLEDLTGIALADGIEVEAILRPYDTCQHTMRKEQQ